ncbi:Pxmp2 [Symbiodinium pilosum]|uniref:Pxmp2 protein n=1 Tax=Symbiodinium pilosum TaxID=2952 RepID=A0A812N5V0_SYMPI|nr:Pxmp2 [Symbiodinium pilosum]
MLKALIMVAGSQARRLCNRLLLEEHPQNFVPAQEALWPIDHPGPSPHESMYDAMTDFSDRCVSIGGRLWEVLPSSPRLHGSALCMAKACSAREVQAWLIRDRRAALLNRTEALVAELGHWRDLQLKFVVAGFEKCGTSSLSHNLARHPEVQFFPPTMMDARSNTDNQNAQDGHFFWQVGGRLLPPADLVRRFNAGLCCLGGARPPGFRDTELIGPVKRGAQVIGERNPVYAFQRIIMKMVSLVPSARVVLLVCDPIRWLHSAYGDTLNWYAGGKEDPPRPPLREFATSDFVAVSKPTSMSYKWYNLSRRRAYFTFFAEGVTRLLGDARVHMLHRDSIDQRFASTSGVRDAYNRLASFLQLRPFPEDFSFEKRNVRAKVAVPQSLELCSHSERHTLKVLKRYYRAEYARLPAWIGRLGGLVPARVASNRTCCDA